MPSIHEVRLYLSGLWLLIKGDAQGFRLLDVSDRGMTRSFWAFAWCLPAAIASWLWLHQLMLDGLPQGTQLGPLFFVRTAMLEVMNWLVPLILAGVLCLLTGIQRKFPAIVVTMNWLSVPFSWAYGLMCVMMLLAPRMLPVVGLFQLELPAHPNPNPATSAMAAIQTARVQSRFGCSSCKASSRIGLR